jgi:hypothetical protein
MLFKELMFVYRDKTHKNKLCGENAVVLNVKAVGRRSNHCALSGSVVQVRGRSGVSYRWAATGR